jgi:hypothetical protein
MPIGQEPCHRVPCRAAAPPVLSKPVIGAARLGAATPGPWQERRRRISEVRRAQHARGAHQPPRWPDGCRARAHVSRMGRVCRDEPALDAPSLGPTRSWLQEESPPPPQTCSTAGPWCILHSPFCSVGVGGEREWVKEKNRQRPGLAGALYEGRSQPSLRRWPRLACAPGKSRLLAWRRPTGKQLVVLQEMLPGDVAQAMAGLF